MTAIAAGQLLPPLCVDLDGSLVRSNLLLESVLRLISRNPWYLFRLPFWLLRGRAALQAEVAARVELNAVFLPYDTALLKLLQTEQARGRTLWLCSTAPEPLAAAIASHLGLHAAVVALDARQDPGGGRRQRRLVSLFGEGGFEHCGGFQPGAPRWRALVRALRPHQWAKNVLILVPLLAAHRAGNLAALGTTLLAVLAFSLCASAVYVINDLLDLEADRGHPRKAGRPFAAGDAPIALGLLIIPVLLAAAAILATLLPGSFRLVLAVYFTLTLAYSLDLKRRVLIDVMALAGLYTLRIIAGGAATAITLSFWLLLFSVFLFLSLALAKRYAELDDLRRQQRLRAVGRGYQTDDLPILRSLGTAAGYLSVLVLALYINSPEVGALYHRPRIIGLLCVAVLYWISRLWIVAQRGALRDDPLIYALTDRVSLMTGLFAAVIIALAI